MNDFGYSKAQEQYDRQLPKRYIEEPLTYCGCCGEGIYKGETIYRVEYDSVNHLIFCKDCVEKDIAEEFE